MTRRNIFMNDKVWERLKKLAEKNGTGIAELVRRAVIEFLKREEEGE